MGAAATGVLRKRRGVKGEADWVLDMSVGLGLFGRREFLGFTQRADRGLIGRCLREQRAVLADDVSAEPDYCGDRGHARGPLGARRARDGGRPRLGGDHAPGPARVGLRRRGRCACCARWPTSSAPRCAPPRSTTSSSAPTWAPPRRSAPRWRPRTPTPPSTRARSSQRAEAVGPRARACPTSDLRMLRYAAAFHDIGKLAVPEAILNKPGPLTAARARAWSSATP